MYQKSYKIYNKYLDNNLKYKLISDITNININLFLENKNDLNIYMDKEDNIYIDIKKDSYISSIINDINNLLNNNNLFIRQIKIHLNYEKSNTCTISKYIIINKKIITICIELNINKCMKEYNKKTDKKYIYWGYIFSLDKDKDIKYNLLKCI